MFTRWQGTAKTRVRGRDFSWFWKVKFRLLGASSTKMRRYINGAIHHLGYKQYRVLLEGKGEAHWARAKLYLLQKDHAVRWWHAFLPLSTSHFLSVSRVPDLGNFLLLLCKPWPSFLLPCGLFLHKAFDVFQPVDFSPSDQCTQAGMLQIPAAFSGTSHIPVQLVFAGLGVSCSTAGYRPIETCLVAQPCLPQGGGEKQKLSVEIYWLWKPHDFLLNLKIPSIIISKPPVQAFMIYLNIAGSEVFFGQWHQSIICHRGEI